MNGRGYAAVGLDRAKTPSNLGGVLRAAGCYGAKLVLLSGGRMGKYATDTMQAWKHIPCIEVVDLIAHIPFGAIPIAVEILPRSRSLVTFTHPERAFYIFGPEDGSIKKEILARVAHVVSIPTDRCMNLAATVNVVLYDRIAKEQR